MTILESRIQSTLFRRKETSQSKNNKREIKYRWSTLPPCFRINCSRYKKVRLWDTRCRTCTKLFQLPVLNSAWHSIHCWFLTIKTTVKDCCRIVPFWTSFCIVNRTLSLIECGSVQIHAASINRIFLPLPLAAFNPLTLERQSAISSRLSNAHDIHFPASLCHRWQLLHWCSETSVLIPWVISDELAKQEAQVFAEFGAIGIPHWQHSTWTKFWIGLSETSAAAWGPSIIKTAQND